MKNEIKKIILSVDDSFKGMVVVSTNSIKAYGYGKISDIDLKKEYTKCVKSLIAENESLKEMSLQDVVNKLRDDGIIEVTNKELVTKITTYEEEEGKLAKFIMTTTSGEKEFKVDEHYDKDDLLDELIKRLEDLADTYDIEFSKDITSDDIFKKLKALGIYERKIAHKKADELGTEDDDKDDDKELLSTKIKNLVVNHKGITALAVAGVLALTGSSLYGCGKKDYENTEDMHNNLVTLEPNPFVLSDELFTPIPSPTPVPTEIPDLTEDEIDYFDEISYDNGYLIPFTHYDMICNDKLISKKINGNGNKTLNYVTMDDLIETRNFDMSNIANYIQSGIPYDDKGTLIYFDNMFCNERDKAFVRYFSMIGNEILYNANKLNNFSGNKGVNDFVNYSALEVVRLIRDDNALPVNIFGQEEYIHFSELSFDAKKAVLNIAWANVLPLNSQIVFQGENAYNQDDISTIILEKAEMLGLTK